MDFLVTMITDVPTTVDEDMVDRTRARETARVAELASADHLLRLWKPPMPANAPAAEIRTLGLFRAGNAGELNGILQSLPMHVWSRFKTVALQPHPHDPGR